MISDHGIRITETAHEWRAEIDRHMHQPQKHPVRFIKVVEDVMHDRLLTYIRWWDDLGVVWEGEMVRYMFEDTSFDVGTFLDEQWGKCIDAVGWCDWQWVE